VAEFGATNYVWRPDVERHVRAIAVRVGCSVNNYNNHGGGNAPQLTSADFWHSRGRGWFIEDDKARQVMRLVRRHADRHPWLYMIYEDRGYRPNGTQFVPFGGAEWNAGHVHVSWA